MCNHQMLAHLFIYEQTHIHVRVSHFPPFALMAALGSNSTGLIHLKLEEVFKDSVLRVPYKKDTSIGLRRLFKKYEE